MLIQSPILSLIVRHSFDIPYSMQETGRIKT